MQRKLTSLSEVVAGTAIGFVVSWCAQLWVFPLYGMRLTYSENTQITIIFTLISIVRGYVVRRFFNHLTGRGIK